MPAGSNVAASGKPALLAVGGDGCAKATRCVASGSARSSQQQDHSEFVQPAQTMAAASQEAVANDPAAGCNAPPASIVQGRRQQQAATCWMCVA